MRRVFATLVTASLIVITSCSRTYDYRLDMTVDNMKYQKRLNDNLMPPATKGKFDELLISIRPPQTLTQSPEFLLSAPPPGTFDLEQSFQESGKQSLHVLARVKRPKTAKKVQAPADTAVRRDFNSEVLAILNSAFKPAEEAVSSKFKPVEKKRANSPRRATSSDNTPSCLMARPFRSISTRKTPTTWPSSSSIQRPSTSTC